MLPVWENEWPLHITPNVFFIYIWYTICGDLHIYPNCCRVWLLKPNHMLVLTVHHHPFFWWELRCGGGAYIGQSRFLPCALFCWGWGEMLAGMVQRHHPCWDSEKRQWAYESCAAHTPPPALAQLQLADYDARRLMSPDNPYFRSAPISSWSIKGAHAWPPSWHLKVGDTIGWKSLTSQF